MTRLAMTTAVVVTTLAAVVLLWHFRTVVLLFAFSLALAAAVRPFVDRLVAQRWPKTLALLTVYLLGIAVVAALLAGAGWLITGELYRAGEDLRRVYRYVADHWAQDGTLQQAVARRIPPPEELFTTLAGRHGSELLVLLAGSTFSLFDSVVNVLLIVVLSMYWTLDRVHFERLWLSLVPVSVRPAGRETALAMEVEVGAYLRNEAAQSVLAGLVLWGGYHALGLPYPTLLATVAAVVWLLPWVGAVLAVLASMILAAPAMILGEPEAVVRALAAAALTGAVLAGLESLVEPRLFNRRRYDSLLMVFAAIALADAFGILGLLIGPMLEVALQVAVEHWLRARAAAATAATAPLESFDARVARMRASAAAVKDLPPQLDNILLRLDALVDQSRAVLD